MGLLDLAKMGKTDEQKNTTERVEAKMKLSSGSGRTPALDNDHHMSPFDSMNFQTNIEIEGPEQTHEQNNLNISPKKKTKIPGSK